MGQFQNDQLQAIGREFYVCIKYKKSIFKKFQLHKGGHVTPLFKNVKQIRHVQMFDKLLMWNLRRGALVCSRSCGLLGLLATMSCTGSCQVGPAPASCPVYGIVSWILRRYTKRTARLWPANKFFNPTLATMMIQYKHDKRIRQNFICQNRK